MRVGLVKMYESGATRGDVLNHVKCQALGRA